MSAIVAVLATDKIRRRRDEEALGDGISGAQGTKRCGWYIPDARHLDDSSWGGSGLFDRLSRQAMMVWKAMRVT